MTIYIGCFFGGIAYVLVGRWLVSVVDRRGLLRRWYWAGGRYGSGWMAWAWPIALAWFLLRQRRYDSRVRRAS